MVQVELEPDNNNVVKPRNKSVMSSSTRLKKSGFLHQTVQTLDEKRSLWLLWKKYINRIKSLTFEITENNITQCFALQLKSIRVLSQFLQFFGPKFDAQSFDDLHILYKLWIRDCSASSKNQNKNNFMFATCNKHVNQQRIEHQILT